MQPIYIIGMMGSGKSKLGKALAKKLKVNFIDTDAEIERITGKKIVEVLHLDFAKLELKVLKSVSKDSVVATGGRTYLDAENRKFIQNSENVFWLDVYPETILGRLKKKDLVKRGLNNLSKSELKQVITDMYKMRKKIYKQRSKRVDGNKTVKEILKQSEFV